MNSYPFPTSPSYQAQIRGLLQLHRLTLAGQNESEEAEAVRESMAVSWESLSRIERERITGLSLDLYDISDQPNRPAEPMSPVVQGKLNEVYEARERGDWDKVLELLRQWGRYVPLALLCYLRGTVWHRAGDPATAAVFFEHALELDPANSVFESVLLETLKK